VPRNISRAGSLPSSGRRRRRLHLPAFGGAHEIPAVGRDAVDVKPPRLAVVWHVELGADPVGHQDLQIGDRERGVAGDPHIGQPGKMRDALLDRAVMLGVRRAPAIAARPRGAGKSAPRSNSPSSVHTLEV